MFITKTLYQSIHQQNPDTAVVDLYDSVNGHSQIDILHKWTVMSKKLEPLCGYAKGHPMDLPVPHQFCNFLLNVDAAYKHKFVAFGFFKQDDIEHHFAHSGCQRGIHFKSQFKMLLTPMPSIEQS